MTAFDKKVNQIAARHGWNISPVSGWYIPAYSIVPMDRKERDQITAALNRCKSFHVDVLQAFSACAWTCNKKNHVSSTFAHAFMYGRKLD